MLHRFVLYVVASAFVGHLDSGIVGTVRDAHMILPGTWLTVSRLGGDKSRETVVSRLDGSYRLTLPAGEYEVSAELQGYVKQVQSPVRVGVGSTTRLDLVLELESSKPSVNANPGDPLCCLWTEPLPTRTIPITRSLVEYIRTAWR